MTDCCPLVVVPYVAGMLHPATDLEVRAQFPEARFFELPRKRDGAYAELVEALWRTGRTFVIVEQDIVPPQGAISGLIECPWVWCGHPYVVGDRTPAVMLGLTKFAGVLTRSDPGLAKRALDRRRDPGGWVHWRSVEARLASDLGRSRRHPHVHLPAAAHRHGELTEHVDNPGPDLLAW